MTSVEVTEPYVPLMMDDFEIDDRVYCHGDDGLIRGRVVWFNSDSIELQGDDGKIYWIREKDLGNRFSGVVWRKILPVYLLEEGIRISRAPFYKNEKRAYAEVTNLVHPFGDTSGVLELMFEYPASGTMAAFERSSEFEFKDDRELEEVLLGWEIEE